MPSKVTLDVDYFQARSTITATGCWIWQRFISPTGYGKVGSSIGGYGEQQAHRLAYRVLRNAGAPIDGEIDHLCRTRSCVNPDHLEPVDHQTNMQRAPHNTYIAPRAARTLCINGHPLDGWTASTRQRYCKTCKREASRRWRERQDATRNQRGVLN